MPVSLEQILTTTRRTLPDLQARRGDVERDAARVPSPPSLAAALRGERVAVIAEVKRRSPSAGSIREDLDPAERAERYARHGAAAISVLTDGPFFGGSVEDLRTAATRARVPVIRKDFILDELQVVEARAAGAAAVLLIVRALPPARLDALLGCARASGLDALVEVHTREEVARALDAGAEILGVNSRDLDTFRVDTAAAWRLLPIDPARAPRRRGERYGERRRRGGRRRARARTRCSSVPRSRRRPIPAACSTRSLACPAVPDRDRPVRAKICGLTRPEDAATAARAGASYLGVVFAGGPRRVTPALAAEISAAGRGVPVLGVYGEQSVEEILALSREAGLAGAQLHGRYRREDAARLRAAGLVVWRVVRIAGPAALDTLRDSATDADAVLVEPLVAHAAGGSGVSLDLAVARDARARLDGATMVLAGGLTPETVGPAVGLVRPEVVDVSSGVERLPGIKDPDKIARFLEAVFGHSAIS